MSPFDPGCVKTPTLNLRVEFPSRFRRCGKPIALATSVRRRQLRKQFCASLAQASFHTAWTRSEHSELSELQRSARYVRQISEKPLLFWHPSLVWMAFVRGKKWAHFVFSY